MHAGGGLTRLRYWAGTLSDGTGVAFDRRLGGAVCGRFPTVRDAVTWVGNHQEYTDPTCSRTGRFLVYTGEGKTTPKRTGHLRTA